MKIKLKKKVLRGGVVWWGVSPSSESEVEVVGTKKRLSQTKATMFFSQI